MVRIRGVVFDVGETLVDESRAWTVQAERTGLTPFTLMGALGALIERGEDHLNVWTLLGVDAPTQPTDFVSTDLYPDALDCVQTLRDAGFLIGIAGNQPLGVDKQLKAAGLSADFMASSEAWGVAKPSTEFFSRIVDVARLEPSAILYVGDRLDNDVLPARSAGLRTALIRRGPWGHIHASRPEAELADLRVDSLVELTAAVVGVRR
ncbi:HAD family hydrolase [Glaciibacter flavus]|uniref:HAD family hydrolase n=1 Tax=Orlajensenia flava TaxID=2565934 RepID=UPI003B00CFA8